MKNLFFNMKLRQLLGVIILSTMLSGCNLFDFSNRGDVYVTLVAHNLTGYISLEGAKVFTIPKSVEGVAEKDGTVLLTGIKEGSYEIYASLDGYGSGKTTTYIKTDSLVKASINLQQKQFLTMAPQIQVIKPTEISNITLDDTIEFSIKITDDETPARKIDVEISSDLDGLFLKAP